MSDEKSGGAVLTLKQAATLVGKSERWVQLRAQEGFFESRKRGEYPLLSFVRGVVAYHDALLEKGNKAAAANRATEARTREIELRTAERARRVIPIEDAEAVISEVAAMVNAELAGLPARVTRDLALRREIEAEAGRALDRLRDRASRAIEALSAGQVDLDAQRAEDAG